ncbi:MAG TPA: hypothetical protein VK911_10385 [Vicinamibacterales bacterium]|nr:hypothetical protein [Vicinamibacterales bacterium]
MRGDVDGENGDLSRWLDAERAGSPGAADQAFAALIAARVPPLAPPPGFADLVVARAAAASRAKATRHPVGARLAIAAAVILMGLPFAFFAGVDVFDLVAAWATRLVPALVGGFEALRPAFALASSVWAAAAGVGHAVLAVAATGTGPLVLVLNVLLAAGGFLGLRRLLAPPKECW